MSAFAARSISVPVADGVADWRAWGVSMIDLIKAAETVEQLSAVIDLNRDAFAECCERGIDDALVRRRLQIKADLPREEVNPHLLAGI